MTTIYRVDRNHLGVRMGVLVALLAGFAAGILLLPMLLRLVGLQGWPVSLLTIAGALGSAFGLSWIAENVLGSIWPSGRRLEVGSDRIALSGPEDEAVDIDLSQPVDVWSWCFTISDRRAWVPRGWYCAALRLAQQGKTITPYTFVKPSDAVRLPAWSAFDELISVKLASQPGQEHLAQFLDQQEHLRAAEGERWRNGAEMQPQDFAALIRLLQEKAEGWPPRGLA